MPCGKASSEESKVVLSICHSMARGPLLWGRITYFIEENI